MPPSSIRSFAKRALRFLFRTLSLMLAVALVLAFVAWRRSTTPLDPLPAAADAGIDLEAFWNGELSFPGPAWQPVDPALLDWDTDALEKARMTARSLDTSSLIVLHRGLPVALWGDVARREHSQSIRKALVGSLFGLLEAEGSLDLGTTLAQLGIDDDSPLTEIEKSATVQDLLLARSGVYHSAIYETSSWKRQKPERGSAAPGEEWFYNNWGFNALSTIYERVAGRSYDVAFAERIAEPIGMQDFRPEDVVYLTRDDLAERIQGNESDHPAAIFMISARDLARFGLLYLAEGRWGDRRILPAEWVAESTLAGALPIGWNEVRWGYLWWVYPPSEEIPYWRAIASGGRGHKLTVIPDLDLVVVHRIPDGGAGLGSQLFRRFIWHPSVDDDDQDAILAGILEAYPDLPAPGPLPMAEGSTAEESETATAAADPTPEAAEARPE
jgi:CubicO group peptidase (beta-lactamase class C family)